MIYVTSDLHGCSPETFRRLLTEAGFSEKDDCFILGDVIDRGAYGAELLEWLMYQINVRMILGNHEAMLLDCQFIFDEVTEESLDALRSIDLAHLERWMRNGGEATMEGLKRMSPETRSAILEYVRELPLYETVSIGDRDFLLTHAGLGNYSPEKRLQDYSDHDLIWARPTVEDRYSEEFYTVFGHTPAGYLDRNFAGRAYITPTWADVDTGGLPMLLRLDDMKEFYLSSQQNG